MTNKHELLVQTKVIGLRVNVVKIYQNIPEVKFRSTFFCNFVNNFVCETCTILYVYQVIMILKALR